MKMSDNAKSVTFLLKKKIHRKQIGVIARLILQEKKTVVSSRSSKIISTNIKNEKIHA